MTRQRVTYQGQELVTSPSTIHTICRTSALVSAFKRTDVSGLIGAEIPVYGVHEECRGLGIVQRWRLVRLCLRLLVLDN